MAFGLKFWQVELQFCAFWCFGHFKTRQIQLTFQESN